jgi:tRNA-intron endonuclease
MEKTAIYTGGFFVLLDEENGPELYREGFYGKPLGIDKPKTPIFKAKIILSFYEALYLKRKKNLKILDSLGNEIKEEEILKEASNYIDDFDIKFAVYEDLRNKGYIPKPGMKYGVTYLVYEYGPGLDHAPFLVHVIKQAENMEVLEILRAGRLSHSVKKRLIIATVEPKSYRISYYLFKWFE